MNSNDNRRFINENDNSVEKKDNIKYKSIQNIEDNFNADNDYILDNISDIKNSDLDDAIEKETYESKEISITTAPVFNKPIDENDFEVENEQLKTDDIPYIDDEAIDAFKNDFLSKTKEKKKMISEDGYKENNNVVVRNQTLLGDDFEVENSNLKRNSGSIIEFVNKKQKNIVSNNQNVQDNGKQSGLFDINIKKKKKGLLSKIADVFGTASLVSANEIENVFADNSNEEENDIYTTPAIKRKIG